MVQRLDLWTIYDRPKDHPDSFVVRRWQIGPQGVLYAEASARLADTLALARKLVPYGLTCIPRGPGDDPVIVETWI